MADSAFQGVSGATKAIMKRLQCGSHKRGQAGSIVRCASSVTEISIVKKARGYA